MHMEKTAPMTSEKKKYTSFHALSLAFQASPAGMTLYMALPAAQSVLQTAVTAVATANFVDTATAILGGARPYADIRPALALVLITLGFVNTLGAVSKLAASKVNVSLQRTLKPAIVKTTAALGFQLSRSLENLSRAGEYMRDLGAFAALSEAQDALTEPDREPAAVDSLEFRNVRFHYPGSGEYILDGLSFRLEAGQHYAFVGRNGAGKTTITRLLTGLYLEYEGEILINGRELRRYPAGAVKAMFSVVYQDFAKYYIEMRDNIALGDLHGTGREAEAARLAGLGEMMDGLERGIDTPLGKILKGGQDISGGQWQRVAISDGSAERDSDKIRTTLTEAGFEKDGIELSDMLSPEFDGIDISGGQWQRVAIARGLYRSNAFIVLDEPTSAIDPVEETRIYKQFARLAKGKCALVVTHRIGSARLADRIVVMEDGGIADEGTHEELIARPGPYARMWEAQAQWYERE